MSEEICLGSAHVSCAGDGVPPSRTFSHAAILATFAWLGKFVGAKRVDQHARRMRYPTGELSLVTK